MALRLCFGKAAARAVGLIFKLRHYRQAAGAVVSPERDDAGAGMKLYWYGYTRADLARPSMALSVPS